MKTKDKNLKSISQLVKQRLTVFWAMEAKDIIKDPYVLEF